MLTTAHPKSISTKVASQYLTEAGFPVKPGTLEVWRCLSKGPKFKKISSRVFYEKVWLDEFLEGLEVKIFDPAKM